MKIGEVLRAFEKLEMTRAIEVYTLEQGAYLLRGKWGAGETASSGLLAGFAVGVDEVCMA